MQRTASTVAVRPMTSRQLATDGAGEPSSATSGASARVRPTPLAAAASSCSHPACVPPTTLSARKTLYLKGGVEQAGRSSSVRWA